MVQTLSQQVCKFLELLLLFARIVGLLDVATNLVLQLVRKLQIIHNCVCKIYPALKCVLLAFEHSQLVAKLPVEPGHEKHAEQNENRDEDCLN